MNPFRKDGHLTESAILTLAAEQEVNELERLEIAEHLAYCDRCLERYTDALAQGTLLAPAHSCRETIWRQIRLRTVRILTSRYATAAAAIALALLVVWGGDRTPVSLPENEPTISEQWNTSLNRAIDGLHDFFDGLNLRHDRSTQGGFGI